MPSSRASSPLSSATPSPNNLPTLLPSSIISDSKRDDRSETSSTAILDRPSDDESDLTEEEDALNPVIEEGEVRVSDMRVKHDVDPDDVVDLFDNEQPFSPWSSPSPSLTPPPSVSRPAEKLPVIGSIRSPREESIEPDDELSDVEDEDPVKDDDEMSQTHDLELPTEEQDAEIAPVEEQEPKEDVDVPDETTQIEPEVEDPLENDMIEPELAIQIDAPEASDKEIEAEPIEPLPSKSSHAPLPTQAHMKELLRLEIKFAAIRDQLYVERMEEVAAEEQMILDGTHPAVQYLYKTLSDRRERLHEVASRRHQEAKAELKRARESDKNHTWSWWTEQRDQLHWEEFEATWSKRRRLAREKNEIETPRIVKPVPTAGGRIRNFDWSAGAAPTRMSMDDASADLAMMENRPVVPTHLTHMSRHASPVVYAPPTVQPVHSSSMSTNGQTNGMTAHRQPSTQPPPTFPYGNGQYSMPRTQTAQSTTAQNRPPVSRPQGRTVPTTSDLFESGRKDPTPLPWSKPESGRAKDALGLTTNSTAPPASREERPANRFPGLAEYMNSASQRPITGNGMGGYSAGNKILSPPTSTSNTASILGSFGRPSGTFGSSNASATPAGTSTSRP